MVFGVRRHVERIDMLFSLLNPQMAAGARRVYGDRFRGVSTVVARRSYMHGFAATVFERLNAAEESVAAEEGRYALALIDDGSKAESARDAFAEKHGLWLGSATSKRSMDVGSFHQGRSDGTGTDLGQTRVRARPALPV